MSLYVSSIRSQAPQEYTNRLNSRHSKTFSAQHKKKLSAPKYAQNMKKAQEIQARQRYMEQIIPKDIKSPVQIPNQRSMPRQPQLFQRKKFTQVQKPVNTLKKKASFEYGQTSYDMTEEKFMELFNTTPQNVIEYEGGTKNITGYGDQYELKDKTIPALKSTVSTESEQNNASIQQYLKTFDSLHQNQQSLDQQVTDLRSNLQHSLRSSYRQLKEQESINPQSGPTIEPNSTIAHHISQEIPLTQNNTEIDKKHTANNSGHLGSGRRLSFYQRIMGGRNSNMGPNDDQGAYSPEFELNIMQKNEPADDKSIRNRQLQDKNLDKKQTVTRIFEISKVPKIGSTQKLPKQIQSDAPVQTNEALTYWDNVHNRKLNTEDREDPKLTRVFSANTNYGNTESRRFFTMPGKGNRSFTLSKIPKQGMLCFRPGSTNDQSFTISSQLKELSMKHQPKPMGIVKKKAQETQTDEKQDQGQIKQEVSNQAQLQNRSFEAQFYDAPRQPTHQTTQSLNIDHPKLQPKNSHRKSQSDINDVQKQSSKGDTLKRDTLRGSIRNDPIQLQMAEMSLDREPDQHSYNILQGHGFTMQTSSAILSPTLKDHQSLLNSFLKSRASLPQEKSSGVSILDDQGHHSNLANYFQTKREEALAEERRQQQIEEDAKKSKAKPEFTARYHFSTFSKTFNKVDYDKDKVFSEPKISISDISSNQSEHDHIYYQAKLQEAYDEEENMLKQNIRVDQYPTSTLTTNQDFFTEELVRQQLKEAQQIGTRNMGSFNATQATMLGLDDQEMDQIEVQLESIIDTFNIDLNTLKD